MNSTYRKIVIMYMNQYITVWSVIARQTTMTRAKIKSKIEGSREFCMGRNEPSSKSSSLYYTSKVFQLTPSACFCHTKQPWTGQRFFPATFPHGEPPFLKLLYWNVVYGSVLCLADQHCHIFLINSKWKISQTELFCKFLFHRTTLRCHTWGGVIQWCVQLTV